MNVQDNHCYSPWSCEWPGLCGPVQVGNSPWVSVCVCGGGGGGQVLVSYRGEYSDSESPKKMWVAQLLSVHSRKEMVLQVFAKSAQEIRGEIRR